MSTQSATRLGVDLVEVTRMAQLDSTPGLAEQLFTPKEIAYCSSQRSPQIAFASCFAAKEAFLKAAGLGLHGGTAFPEIEIDCHLPRRPQLILHGVMKTRLTPPTQILLSIGTCREMACAVVALEEKRIH
jgi:holo-[acyl-carrier protein] synthase